MSNTTPPPPPPGDRPYSGDRMGDGYPQDAGHQPGPGYGQAPGYDQGQAFGGPRPHPKGTLILVLGILSIVCASILGPFAFFMGNKALKEIDANPAAYTNRSQVNIGRILGLIGTILLVLGIIYWLWAFASGNNPLTNPATTPTL